MSTREITKTDNLPPVTLPTDDEMLADLKRRYPEIDIRLDEWKSSFTTYNDPETGKPAEIPLDQGDVASALQDLIGQVKKDSKVWTDSFQKQEKKPLNALVKIVGNFFTGRVEKADSYVDTYEPTYKSFLQRKADASIKAAEEEAERQREIERLARAAADKAKREQEESEARAAAKRREEEAAREAAEKARADQEAAEAARAAAKEEERRLADEKRQRDKEEKELNVTNIRDIRGHMKAAEKLHALAEAEEASDEETAELEALVKSGGTIGNLAAPVANSMLLDDDQKTFIDATRIRLGELRTAISARLGKREQKRREKEQAAADAAEALAAAERKKKREEEDKALAEATKKRQDEEEKAKLLADERKKQEGLARDARDAARDEERDAKDAGKEAKAHTTEADRTANRADRIETKLEKSTDADHSRTRGELGTVGGLARRWAYHIVDEAALRAGFIVPEHLAPSAGLAEHLTTDALEGAVFRWMRAHQASFTGERVEGLLPGVVFAYEQEARIV